MAFIRPYQPTDFEATAFIVSAAPEYHVQVTAWYPTCTGSKTEVLSDYKNT